LWIELNTRVEAPSQHCPVCGSRKRKDLDERTHECLDCGHVEQRDAAAARYMLGRVYGVVRPKKKQKTRHVPAARSCPSGNQPGGELAGKGTGRKAKAA
jgi:transposase